MKAMRWERGLFLFLFSVIPVASIFGEALVISSNTTIEAAQADYDGQDIVVSNAVLTVRGDHSFSSLSTVSDGAVAQEGSFLTATNLALSGASTYTVAGGGTLTVIENIAVRDHSCIVAASIDTSAKIDGAWVGRGVMIEASNVVVEVGARITADGQGYPKMKGPGVPTSNSASYGAAHGGRGGRTTVGLYSGTTYGSAVEPLDLGSGGGGSGTLTTGGGAIRLKCADLLQLDGVITASGTNQATNVSGASGGAILLEVDRLAGSGRVEANGGAGGSNGVPGGGGRVAVYYRDMSGFAAPSNIRAAAGGPAAENGTVGLFPQGADGSLPRLVVTEGVFELPASGAPNIYESIVVGSSTVSSGAVLVVPSNGDTTALRVNDLQLLGDASLVCLSSNAGAQVGGAWVGRGVMIEASNVVVEAAARITADGQGYPKMKGPGLPTGNSYSYGAAHGGRGGRTTSSSYSGTTYGNPFRPKELGSGGSTATYPMTTTGGGVIHIRCSGMLLLDGLITACGTNSTSYASGASGGSILLEVNQLAGSGGITANGGTGGSGCAPGGGGRIALYYDDAGGFDDFSHIESTAGGPGAEDGTVVLVENGSVNSKPNMISASGLLDLSATPFLETSTFQLGLAGTTNDIGLHMGADAVLKSTSFLCRSNATITMEGGGALLSRGDMVFESGVHLQARTKHVEGHVQGRWAGEGVLICGSNLVVETGAWFDTDGMGYGGGMGPGAGRVISSSMTSYYGGAGHGGAGGDAKASSFWISNGGHIYGNPELPVAPGSGGAIQALAAPTNSCGGGAIMLLAGGRLDWNGNMTANGLTPSVNSGGGGSGGSLLVCANEAAGWGQLTVTGGVGGDGSGGGGGGRIAVYTRSGEPPDTWDIDVSGGAGGYQQYPGQDGTWHAAAFTQPFGADLKAPDAPLLKGEEVLRWSILGVEPHMLHTEVVAFQNGVAYPVADGQGVDAALWDTADLPDGRYMLRATFMDAASNVVATVERPVSILQNVVYHRGTITGNEIWTADSLHVIDGALTLDNNAIVTLAPGCVVKASPAASLTVEYGCTLDARGNPDAPVVLTSLHDDDVGGDSEADGNLSQPQPGDWDGVLGAGAFLTNDFTEFRYGIEYHGGNAAHGGHVAADETWSGKNTHWIASHINIVSGATVRVEAGAVIKGASMRILEGSTLLIEGDADRPVVFTDVADDAYGGDTNRDGADTAPSNKWALYADGQVTLRHARLRYGWGNTPGFTDGAIMATYSTSRVSLDSVVMEHVAGGALSVRDGGIVHAQNLILLEAPCGVLVSTNGLATLNQSTIYGGGSGVLVNGANSNC
jgi:hypothetical protein